MNAVHRSIRRTPSRLRQGLACLALLVAAASVLPACSGDDDNGPGDIYVPPDMGNNGDNNDNNTGDDAGVDGGSDAGDTGADANNEVFDGVMTGTWVVKRASDDAEQVTLEIRHKAGGELTGTFLLADGPEMPAPIDSGSWSSDAFNAAWTARIDGIEETFRVINAAEQSEGYLLGQYEDSRFAMAFDVSIVRVEGP